MIVYIFMSLVVLSQACIMHSADHKIEPKNALKLYSFVEFLEQEALYIDAQVFWNTMLQVLSKSNRRPSLLTIDEYCVVEV